MARRRAVLKRIRAFLAIPIACPIRHQTQKPGARPARPVGPGFPFANRLLPHAQGLGELFLRECQVPPQPLH